MRIHHLIAPDDWAAAVARGTYEPASLAAEGFVHFSFLDQLEATAGRHYRTATELIAVEMDTALIPAPVRVEEGTGTGEQFPHVYGPIPVTAAQRVRRLHRTAEGSWALDPSARDGGPDTSVPGA